MGFLFDVSENRLDDVQERVESGRDDVDQADKSGNTGLHLAAEKGLSKMVRLLVELGANLDMANRCSGWTPLHFAAYEGHHSIVEILLDAGACPDPKDKQGDTPESWALDWENYKSAMILAEATKAMKEKRARQEEEKRRAREYEQEESPENDDDDDEDSDEEELTHWVLPAPAPRNPPEAPAASKTIDLKAVEAAKAAPNSSETRKESQECSSSAESEDFVKVFPPGEESCTNPSESREPIIKGDASSSTEQQQEDQISTQEDSHTAKVHQEERRDEFAEVITPPEEVSHPTSVPIPPPPPPPPPLPPAPTRPADAKLSKKSEAKQSNPGAASTPHSHLMDELLAFTGARRKSVKADEERPSPSGLSSPKEGRKRRKENDPSMEDEAALKTTATTTTPGQHQGPSAPNSPSSPSRSAAAGVVVGNRKEQNPSTDSLDDEKFIRELLQSSKRASEERQNATNTLDTPSIVDKIKNSLSPHPEGRHHVPPLKELAPIPEKESLVIGGEPEKSSSASESLSTARSVPCSNSLDKLRSFTEDSHLSVDLRRSAADIVSMTRCGNLASISRVKEELVLKLQLLIDEERRQLEIDLGRKLEELDEMKRRHAEEETRLEAQINILSEKLDNLTVPPILAQQSMRSMSPSLEKALTCVRCSHICAPPERIYQCSEGDLLCQACKEDPKLRECPECGQILQGNVARNKAMEKLARKHVEV